jgi:hypothetical protein
VRPRRNAFEVIYPTSFKRLIDEASKRRPF